MSRLRRLSIAFSNPLANRPQAVILTVILSEAKDLMNYKGTIIEESLQDSSILAELEITSTKVEPVTYKHKTLWLKQWTLHTINVPEAKAEGIAQRLSQCINQQHASSWYIDYKNNLRHFIIFRDKVFIVDRAKPEEYKAVTRYGVSIGIPEYQLDFFPEVII